MVERDRGSASKSVLGQQLAQIGVGRGSVLLVHSAFSSVGPIEGGPTGLIEALEEAVGFDGTVVMPSMTDDDDRPFDPLKSDCRELDVVPDTFWRRTGVLRSHSPHAFAAKGPAASYITSPHPLDVPHGLDSPAGRVWELDGLVLLLGVGHDANTSVHVAESVAGVRYRRPKHVTIFQDRRPKCIRYLEIDHCCERFSLVDDWLGGVGLQQRGLVGHAHAQLIRSRALVEIVARYLQRDETAFLHPPGVDDECDEARSSLPAD